MSFNPQEHVQLIRVERRPVKSLSGFQKFHRVPEEAGDRENRMLYEICVSELDEIMEQVFSKLRSEYNLKRKDLSASEIEAGCGMISTPDFQFVIQAELDPEKPSQALLTSSISQIQVPDKLYGEAFGNTFGTTFNELLVSCPDPISIEDVVDLLEEIEPAETSLDYDKNCTYCELKFLGTAATVRLEAESISIKTLQPASPRLLFELFVQVKDTLESVLDFQSQTWATT